MKTKKSKKNWLYGLVVLATLSVAACFFVIPQALSPQAEEMKTHAPIPATEAAIIPQQRLIIPSTTTTLYSKDDLNKYIQRLRENMLEGKRNPPVKVNETTKLIRVENVFVQQGNDSQATGWQFIVHVQLGERFEKDLEHQLSEIRVKLEREFPKKGTAQRIYIPSGKLQRF